MLASNWILFQRILRLNRNKKTYFIKYLHSNFVCVCVSLGEFKLHAVWKRLVMQILVWKRDSAAQPHQIVIVPASGAALPNGNAQGLFPWFIFLLPPPIPRTLSNAYLVRFMQINWVPGNNDASYGTSLLRYWLMEMIIISHCYHKWDLK